MFVRGVVRKFGCYKIWVKCTFTCVGTLLIRSGGLSLLYRSRCGRKHRLLHWGAHRWWGICALTWHFLSPFLSIGRLRFASSLASRHPVPYFVSSHFIVSRFTSLHRTSLGIALPYLTSPHRESHRLVQPRQLAVVTMPRVILRFLIWIRCRP